MHAIDVILDLRGHLVVLPIGERGGGAQPLIEINGASLLLQHARELEIDRKIVRRKRQTVAQRFFLRGVIAAALVLDDDAGVGFVARIVAFGLFQERDGIIIICGVGVDVLQFQHGIL